ncbi:MAG TPA: hypothetical protein VNM87_02550 [Candidatus Udaeobacter sp.]|nr:hypothetical protein [Candidatus Udaeobacter sp.]
MTGFPEVDLAAIRTVSIANRTSKVGIADLAPPPDPKRPIGDFLELLPRQLAAEGLRRLVDAIAAAHAAHRPVVAMLGGHVVKVGASPVLLALARERIVTCLAMNGAGAIHDFELAMWGQTSETVEETLSGGAFGMVGETATLMNEATREGERQGLGLGEALGRKLLQLEAPYRRQSLLATGLELGMPVTVHVALGTDTLHQHPSASGAAIGDTSLRDFRRLAAHLRDLSGGVVLNLGSAVIMPEVFLKALSVVRNLGAPLTALTTANLDFQRHYRPGKNVLERPTRGIGEGIELVGHHEIMLPLLAGLVLARVRRAPAGA